MTSIRCRRTGSGSLSRISASSSLAGFDGVFDKSLALRFGALAMLLPMRRASSWVSTLAMCVCHSRSRVSRSRNLAFQFLSAACSELRDFLPVHKVRVRQRDLGLIYAGVAFQVVLSSRAELATF